MFTVSFQNNSYNPSFGVKGTKFEIAKETLQELLKTMSVEEVAKQYNISIYPIYKKMGEYNIKKRISFDAPKAELEELVKKKYSIADLAKMYEKSKSAISHRLNYLGLKVYKEPSKTLKNEKKIRLSHKEILNVLSQKISNSKAAEILNMPEKMVIKARVYMRKHKSI